MPPGLTVGGGGVPPPHILPAGGDPPRWRAAATAGSGGRRRGVRAPERRRRLRRGAGWATAGRAAAVPRSGPRAEPSGAGGGPGGRTVAARAARSSGGGPAARAPRPAACPTPTSVPCPPRPAHDVPPDPSPAIDAPIEPPATCDRRPLRRWQNGPPSVDTPRPGLLKFVSTLHLRVLIPKPRTRGQPVTRRVRTAGSLDPRSQSILRAVIEEYVDSATPVGSAALVERYRLGVSSATVRNILVGPRGGRAADAPAHVRRPRPDRRGLPLLRRVDRRQRDRCRRSSS